MYNKKILAFMLSLAIICPIGSTPMAELIPNITANAEDSTLTDENYFTFDATTGTITKYTGSNTDVVIPSTIGDVAVTSIGESAFNSCTSLKNINVDKLQFECDKFSFPEGVTVNYAHSVTYKLNNITSSNQDDRVSVNNDYTATLTAKNGYTFVDGVLTIDAKKVTGNITITATAEKIEEPIQFTSSDLLKLKKHILGISKIDDISSLDVNQDNKLNILDFLTIKNSILNQ